MQVEPAFNVRTFVAGQSKDSSVNSVKPGGLKQRCLKPLYHDHEGQN